MLRKIEDPELAHEMWRIGALYDEEGVRWASYYLYPRDNGWRVDGELFTSSWHRHNYYVHVEE